MSWKKKTLLIKKGCNLNQKVFICIITGAKLSNILTFLIRNTAWKLSEFEVFYGPYFPLFGLNMEIYSANLCIQSKYGKIQTRKCSCYAVRTFLKRNGFRDLWVTDGEFLKQSCFHKCGTLRDLVPLSTLLKLTLLQGYLSRFLNCTNGAKSRNASQITFKR